MSLPYIYIYILNAPEEFIIVAHESIWMTLCILSNLEESNMIQLVP